MNYKNLTERTIKLLDVTSLNSHDTNERMETLCKKALSLPYPVAAMCVYPQFLPLVKTVLGSESSIGLATVVNFPEGKLATKETCLEIKDAIKKGVTEIDVVFPYHAFLRDQLQEVRDFMSEVRKASLGKIVKVILETGAYPDDKAIYEATHLCIETGCNFVKTSTGKIPKGATLEAARTMLYAIYDSHGSCGLKISGGIRTLDDVANYFALADDIMGKEWISPATFRIGASSLIDTLA